MTEGVSGGRAILNADLLNEESERRSLFHSEIERRSESLTTVRRSLMTQGSVALLEPNTKVTADVFQI